MSRTAREIMGDLAAAGLAPEHMALVIELTAALAGEKERQPSPGAIRTRRWRERVIASQSVTSDASDVKASRGDAPAAPPKVPPTPPLNTPSSVKANAFTAADAALADIDAVDEDPKARLFRLGKTILISFGISERQTGALIGQWLKRQPDPSGLLAAIQFARDQNVAEPVAYISTVIANGKANGRHGKTDLSKLALELAAEVRERELAAGIGR